MKALVISDTMFASRERTMLSRLCIGLADEGVRVIRAVPEQDGVRASEGQGTDVASGLVTYSDLKVPFTVGLRAQRLIDTLAGHDTDDVPGDVDVVHVFGGSAWDIGLETGRRLGAPVVLEVWRHGLVARAVGLGNKLTPPPTLMTPDEALARSLRAGLGAGTVTTTRLAPWGVYAPATFEDSPDRGPTPSIMMVGSGYDARAFAAAMTGIAGVMRDRPNLLVFADAHAAHRAGIWRLASTLGVVDRLSLIQDLEARRDLLVSGDVLVQPEALGEQRSVILEAMASGMILIAARDPTVALLQDGVTARLVDRVDSAAWSSTIAAYIDRSPEGHLLARSAYEYVRERRRVSGHVRAVLEAYASLAGRPPLTFKAG
ncbi:MAG: glycosyltransferase [Phycisphaeraceae bacterium]|nr:MAG: glycosyltransferase [Phycisphaeraceae bacterium]